jgi:hypothetical protein
MSEIRIIESTNYKGVQMNKENKSLRLTERDIEYITWIAEQQARSFCGDFGEVSLIDWHIRNSARIIYFCIRIFIACIFWGITHVLAEDEAFIPSSQLTALLVVSQPLSLNHV